MATITPTVVLGVLLYPALILGVLYLVYRHRSGGDDADGGAADDGRNGPGDAGDGSTGD